MNHKITHLSDGKLLLELGLRYNVTFDADATPDDIINGVVELITNVTGIDAFEIAADVVQEMKYADG